MNWPMEFTRSRDGSIMVVLLLHPSRDASHYGHDNYRWREMLSSWSLGITIVIAFIAAAMTSLQYL